MNNIVLSEEERIILFETMKLGMEAFGLTIQTLPPHLKSIYFKLGGDQGEYCYDL